MIERTNGNEIVSLAPEPYAEYEPADDNEGRWYASRLQSDSVQPRAMFHQLAFDRLPRYCLVQSCG